MRFSVQSSYLYLLICILPMASTATNAQHMTSYRNAGNVGLNITDQMFLMDSRKVLDGEGGEKFVGSPYLSETFVTGDVYSFRGKHAAIPLRYNIYFDYFEFQKNGVNYILDPGPNIKKVQFGEYSFVVEKSSGRSSLGYYALLDSGTVILLAKKIVTFREAQAAKALESEGRLARYLRMADKYFYKIGDGELNDFKSAKKMIESLPGKHEQMKEFLKKEKITKSEEDLIKLVKYYNSL